MMEPDARFWADKRVCVTGGTGFLGWNLVRQLLPLAAHVRILGLRPNSRSLCTQLESLDCVFADVRDAGPVREAIRDCDIVFHTAGTVAVWGKALQRMHEIHSVGTRQVLEALPARARLVHTSSVVAVGASQGSESLTEASPFLLQNLKSDYVHAKKAAEDVVLQWATRGTDAVVVNPAYLIGPEDHEGSIMGRFCRRCWKGKVPLSPPGGLNLVDVRDVACGHLLAAQRGQSGSRYILGGENLTLGEFVHLLKEIRGMPTREWFRMPFWLYYSIACGLEAYAHLVGREPYPSLQHVRMNRYQWYYSSDRARTELGYRPRPIKETVQDMYAWFCDNGVMHSGKQGATPLAPHAEDRGAA